MTMRSKGWLRGAFTVVGLFGIIASVFLAVTGFVLANLYDSALEYRQLSRPGVNLYQLLAYRYLILAGLVFLYVVLNEMIQDSRWRSLISIPLFVLSIVFGVLILLDSRLLPQFAQKYSTLIFLLTNGGVLVVIAVTILFILNAAILRLNLKMKDFP